jgi:hypothetical protein
VKQTYHKSINVDFCGYFQNLDHAKGKNKSTATIAHPQFLTNQRAIFYNLLILENPQVVLSA